MAPLYCLLIKKVGGLHCLYRAGRGYGTSELLHTVFSGCVPCGLLSLSSISGPIVLLGN